MAQHCYLCGVSIYGDGWRRQVNTGNSSHSGIGISSRGRLSFRSGGGSYSGLRTVCENCAQSIDAANSRSGVWTLLKFLFWFGVIFFVAKACSEVGNHRSSNSYSSGSSSSTTWSAPPASAAEPKEAPTYNRMAPRPAPTTGPRYDKKPGNNPDGLRKCNGPNDQGPCFDG